MVTRHVSEGRAAVSVKLQYGVRHRAHPSLTCRVTHYATAEPCQFAPAKLVVYGTTMKNMAKTSFSHGCHVFQHKTRRERIRLNPRLGH